MEREVYERGGTVDDLMEGMKYLSFQGEMSVI